MLRELIISVGGENKRMRKFLLKHFNGLPKHLLPIPNQKTIIERIIDHAKKYFDKIILSANSKNALIFQKIFKKSKKIIIEIDEFLTGPLGPILRKLLNDKKRIYGCAGDFFCEFSWKEFEKFHNQNGKPISILISPSLSMPNGARFFVDIDNNTITSWERVSKTKDFDLINLGAYIIDPHPEVIKTILLLNSHKEDIFFNYFVPKGLVSGFNPGKIGFNINTSRTYKKFLNWLKRKQLNS